MTGPSSACVAIARPYGACVRGFSGDLADGAHVGGTPGQRFRTLADTTASKWQVQQDTANAVRVYALAGFKSPSLRPLTRASAEILDPGGSPGSASLGRWVHITSETGGSGASQPSGLACSGPGWYRGPPGRL